jgi:hypothetical protein
MTDARFEKAVSLDVIADQALLPRATIEEALNKQTQETASSKAVLTLHTKKRRQRRWAMLLCFISRLPDGYGNCTQTLR